MKYAKDIQKTKQIITYFSLCIYSVVIILLYYASDLLDPLFPYAYSGTLSFIYFLFMIPLASMIYGIVSYRLVRKVLIPNIILLVATGVSVIIFGGLKDDVNVLEELIAIPIIMVIISVFFSVVTLLFIKLINTPK